MAATKEQIPPTNIICTLCKKAFTAEVEIHHEQPHEKAEPVCADCFKISMIMLKLLAKTGDNEAKQLLAKTRR
jgi:hypothetical protein